MGEALEAHRDLPGKPGKPGEFSGRWSIGIAAGRLTEASYLKDNAAWIGEGVTMGAIDGNAGARFGNLLAALAANQPFAVFAGQGLVPYLFLHPVACFFIRFFTKSDNALKSHDHHCIRII